MPYVKSEKRLLLTERQLVVGHRIDDGQAGQLVAGSAQLGAARLEALLNADADAADGRTCLRADSQQTLHGLAVGEEVIQNQNLVRRGEKLLGQRSGKNPQPTAPAANRQCSLQIHRYASSYHQQPDNRAFPLW